MRVFYLLRKPCIFAVLPILLSTRVNILTHAQTPKKTNAAQTHLEYDVVSIKPGNPQSGGLSVGGTDDTVNGKNVTVGLLIQNAYQLRQEYIVGIPGALAAERFDVVGKVTSAKLTELRDLSGEDRRAMLRALLRDYFGLKVHEAHKDVPSFELVLSKSGPKFKSSPIPAGQSSPQPGATTMSSGQFSGHAIPVSSFADSLSGALGRNVVDRTNLRGLYDIHLTWNPYPDSDSSSSDSRPPLLTALQSELGLVMVPVRAQTRILVVDHVSRPTFD